MKFSRETFLAVGLIIVLGIISIAAAVSSQPGIPYLSSSAAPDGTLALRLWLEQLGCSSTDESTPVYHIPSDVDLIFMLEPSVTVSDDEWVMLDAWVSNGGTLILAGDNLQTGLALGHFKFNLAPLNPPADREAFQAPLFLSPPTANMVPVNTGMGLSSTRADYVVLLASGKFPILVSFPEGKGEVVLSASPFPFSNLGLKDEAAASLVLNLLSLSIHHGRVWFDEWHHGVRSASEVIGPDQWLRYTPLGRALLFLVGAVFLGLILQGRGFGRAVPVVRENKRRGPLEHVNAIANLNRKAGHRLAILQQYHDRLKRELGKRYRLDPSAPDEVYVETLARYDPDIDRTSLLSLLKRLSHKNVSEAELVKLAAEAANWTRDQ